MQKFCFIAYSFNAEFNKLEFEVPTNFIISVFMLNRQAQKLGKIQKVFFA